MKRSMVLVMAMVMLCVVVAQAQPARYTNIRSAGFNGAGVAVAPDDETTPLQINPAQPALITDSSMYGVAAALGVNKPDEGDDTTIFGLMGELYFP
ncbi:hypothetical protein JW979_00690, partial [bacterium]|nr:hypothetical protein [candidate division CSSED10-310 bacterium]